MNNMQYQKGMSGPGWILILALIAFFSLVGLKIFPVYINSMTVGSILSDMEDEPGLGAKSPGQILTTFQKRLNINLIKDISQDEIFLDSTTDGYVLEVDYEVRRNFLGNIDLVLGFNKRAEIPKR